MPFSVFLLDIRRGEKNRLYPSNGKSIAQAHRYLSRQKAGFSRAGALLPLSSMRNDGSASSFLLSLVPRPLPNPNSSSLPLACAETPAQNTPPSRLPSLFLPPSPPFASEVLSLKNDVGRWGRSLPCRLWEPDPRESSLPRRLPGAVAQGRGGRERGETSPSRRPGCAQRRRYAPDGQREGAW